MNTPPLKVINRHKVEKIPLPKNEDKRPVLGSVICPEVYSNIFLVAKKKSGKSTAIFNFLKNCTNKKTTIIVFCTTIFKDSNWIAIRKWIEKRGNPHEFFTSIYEDGEDQIKALTDRLSKEAEEREQENEEEEDKPIDNTEEILNYLNRYGFGNKNNLEEETKPKKEKKDKYKTPELVIVLDDIGDQLQSPSLKTLLCWNRHYKCKVIISSQYYNHLQPESRTQLDLILIFKGHPDHKIAEIHKTADLDLPLDQFLMMYKKATQINDNNKFPFFYVDTRNDEFRKCFNQQFQLKKDQNNI